MGGIEGALFLSGEPAPNQRVSITGCQKSETDPLLLLSFSYGTTTDERGRFRFEKVPPGEHSVARERYFCTGRQHDFLPPCPKMGLSGRMTCRPEAIPW